MYYALVADGQPVGTERGPCFLKWTNPTRQARNQARNRSARLALVWRSSGLRLALAWHHKSLFDKYKPLCDKYLQTMHSVLQTDTCSYG